MIKDYRIIALCISKAGDERNFDFIKQLSSVVVKYGYRLFIYQTCSDLYWNTKSEEGDKRVFDLIDYDVVDAVVIFDESFREKGEVNKIIRKAEEKSVPVLCVGSTRKDCTSFVFNYETGFEQIVRHVIEFHGAKDTRFIAGIREEHCSEQRISVYKKVLEENGIAFKEEDLYYGDYWWGPTKQAVESILGSGRIPQAVICANDMMAITVCEEFKKHGYRVPEDVIVTGFDGTWEALSANPPITTSGCSLKEAAEDIVAEIYRIFNGDDEIRQHSINFKSAIYHSCGCNHFAPEYSMGDLLKQAQDRFVRYQDDERALNEMSEKIISCDKPEEVAKHLSEFNFYDLCIIVNNQCINGVVDLSDGNSDIGFEDDMYILYKTYSDISRFPIPFKRREIVPDIEKDYLVRENPLIFSALSFNSIPLGYAAFNFSVDMDNYSKILQFVTAIKNSFGSFLMIKYLKHTADSIEQMSKHDFMTGLLNRKWFYKLLPGIEEMAIKDNSRIVVATVDIDGLKNINDTYGHEDGDYAIKAVADAVKAIPFTNKICGRFGGDEIVVCAATDDKDAETVFLNNFADYLLNANIQSGKKFRVSASVGVEIMEADVFDFEKALKKSDDKMYIMKIGRSNRRKN